jgi:hypothetical protein
MVSRDDSDDRHNPHGVTREVHQACRAVVGVGGHDARHDP